MSDKTQAEELRELTSYNPEARKLIELSATTLEQQQAALLLAEEALEDAVGLIEHLGGNSGCQKKALTAVKDLKSTSHPQPDPSQDQE